MTTERRQFWPWVTLTVAGVPLTFKHRAFPGQRAALWRRLAEAEAEAVAVMDEARKAVKGDPKTNVQPALDRAEMLSVGAVGWYLSQLWDGDKLDAQVKYDADNAEDADRSALHFPGPDHRELFGSAWAHELCEKADLTFDHLVACARALAEVQPPMASKEPGQGEVDEIALSFGAAVGTTI